MTYVALGDSMSIDVYAGGKGRGAASLLHANRNGDFAEWKGRDLASYGLRAWMLAHDGATVGSVLACQIPLVRHAPELVTLTVGGNDLMGGYGNNRRAEAAIARVADTGETIMRRLRELDAGRIVVTTVYDPSDGTGEIPGLKPWLDGPYMVWQLNTVLRGLAERHGAVVADVHGRFLGHGMNAGNPSGFASRPNNRDLWYCGNIEPNAWGANQIRAAWWQAIDDAGWTPTGSPRRARHALSTVIRMFREW